MPPRCKQEGSTSYPRKMFKNMEFCPENKFLERTLSKIQDKPIYMAVYIEDFGIDNRKRSSLHSKVFHCSKQMDVIQTIEQ